MNSDCEVYRRFLLGACSVNATSREVQYVAGREPHIGRNRKVTGNKQLTQPQLVGRNVTHRVVNVPGFCPFELKSENVVVVVVRQKPLGLRWSDVRVDLSFEIQLDFDLASQRGDTGNMMFKTIQNDRVTVTKIVPNTNKIDPTVGEPECFERLLISRAHKADLGMIGPRVFHITFDRSSVEESFKIISAVPLDNVMTGRPYVVNEGVDRERVQQPRQRTPCRHHTSSNFACSSSVGYPFCASLSHAFWYMSL